MNNKKQLIKTCKNCGFTSDNMKFFTGCHNKLKDGSISISYKNHCVKCSRIRLLKNPSDTVKGKVSYIREQKNKPCIDCNVKYPFYVMDFDHCRGEKLFGLSNYSGKSLEDIKLEIEKCDLVCSNCHRIRTHNRRENILNID